MIFFKIGIDILGRIRLCCRETLEGLEFSRRDVFTVTRFRARKLVPFGRIRTSEMFFATYRRDFMPVEIRRHAEGKIQGQKVLRVPAAHHFCSDIEPISATPIEWCEA